MSRNKINLLIGLCIAIMPLSGFPARWKTIFYITAGIILMLIAVIGHMRRRSAVIVRREQHVVTDVFAENGKLPHSE